MGNRFNRALMGYALQSHVRALVVMDSTRRVLARSIIRLLIRSDSLEPVIYCDSLFFAAGFDQGLWKQIILDQRSLRVHMDIPVVHACSTLPVAEVKAEEGGYVRTVAHLGYNVTCAGAGRGDRCPHELLLTAVRPRLLVPRERWVDLLEMDGISPYTYSEELPYDEVLEQHVPGLLHRCTTSPTLTIAALPREDSPSAGEYVRERFGRTMWTMGEAGAADPSRAL